MPEPKTPPSDPDATIPTESRRRAPSSRDAPTIGTVLDPADLMTIPAQAAPPARQAPAPDDTVSTSLDTSDLATMPASRAPMVDPDATIGTMQDPGNAPTIPATGKHARREHVTIATQNPEDGSGSGTFTRTVTLSTRRVVRTRHVPTLDEDWLNLDQRLQCSRTSVLTELPFVVTGRHQQQDSGPIEVSGRYAVRRPLAAGGMGAVLEVDDHDFHRRTAVKVIKGHLTGSSEAVQRFLAEAQVTAQLEHPNIVPIHDLGVMEDGTVYYSMKLIEGESLGSVVKSLRQGKAEALAHWSIEERLLVFLKVLEGVGFAHSRGVIHRDLKPDNVMLGLHGEVLVVDWGIAKVIGGEEVAAIRSVRDDDPQAGTLSGAAMGTLQYMPPEQARGDLDRIGPPSDVYALGATLYELLALRRPIEYPEGKRPDLAAVIRIIYQGGWDRLDTVAPQLPLDLIAIIHKAMALEPEQRYPDCSAMAADLRAFLAGQAVAARRPGALERLARWLQRHRRRLLAGAAVTVLVGSSAGAAIWWQAQERERQVAAFVSSASQLTDDANLEALREAERAVTAALALNPLHREAGFLQVDLRTRIANAEAEHERQAKARIDAETAKQALTSGNSLELDGELAQARDSYRLAVQLQPEDAEAYAALTRVIARLGDAERAARQRAAADEVSRAVAALEAAEAGELTDPAITVELDRAAEALVLANRDGEAPPSAAAAAARLALLRERAEQARERQNRRQAAVAALAMAEAESERGDLDAALASATRALGLAPDLPEALAARDRLRSAVANREAAAEAARAQAQARSRATELLHSGREHLAALSRARQAETASADRVTELERSQATLPLAEKAALWQEREQRERAAAAGVAAWSEAEAAFQAGLAALGEDSAAESYAPLRRALAELYLDRLAAARDAEDGPAQAAFTNLLRRYDDGELLAALDRPGQLELQGALASVTLQPLRSGNDGRWQPAGDARAAAASQDLPPGRWLLRTANGWSARLRVQPGASLNLMLPPATPPDLGQPLRWVPRLDGSGGFWLGEREVSHSDWAAFVSAPTVWPRVQEAFRSAIDDPKAERPMALLPRHARPGPELWQARLGGPEDRDLEGIGVPRSLAPLPVTGIDRDDAEAYCAWLSQRSRRTVRLPNSDEWQLAANFGDEDSPWPWGRAFDPGFTVTIMAGDRSAAAAVDTDTADIGPLGHRHLGGNVREWLSDRIAGDDPAARILNAFIAGGAWASSQPSQFRANARERVDSAIVSPVIGLRILVEHP